MKPAQTRKLHRPALTVLGLLSIAVALYAAIAYSFFPLGSLVHPEMEASFRSNKWSIYAHIFGSAIALLTGPFQFIDRLRSERPRLHRRLGWLYLAFGVTIGGVSGFYLSLHAYGGLPAQSGFAILALLWLYTGYRALAAIKSRALAAHRRWMVRNFALACAAVTLRIYLPATLSLGVPFELAYPAIAWACWVPNLILAEVILRRPSEAPRSCP